MKRTELANIIVDKLENNLEELSERYRLSGSIGHFYVDNLLPEEIALQIRNSFPQGGDMRIKKSLREYKYIAAQMNNYDPILEECVYAFQDERVISLINKITGVKDLEPDEYLYAGGISMMANGHYLNPHVDNSHDKVRERYRVLNLLYYVSPNWSLENGGNLELWPSGVEKERITVQSSFNRLAVMTTHRNSWHSVSKINVNDYRCCISNYYFSKTSPESNEYFHVTSFRGWPDQKIRDIVLRGDMFLRNTIRKFVKSGVLNKSHYYKKEK